MGAGFKAWRYPLALFLLACCLYAPSLRNGFVYDDDTLILKEARPSSVRAFTEIFDQRHFPGLPYYRPVTRLTFRVQRYLHGDHAAPYHLFNVILIGLTAWAAFGLLRVRGFGLSDMAAALAALAFVVHPTASSCVNPICSGRETLLPALLILLAMQAWLRPDWRWQAGAVGIWGLALFAKEQAVVVPLLFLAADLLKLGGEPQRQSRGRQALWYGAMGALLAVYLGLRAGLFHREEFAWAVLSNPWLPCLAYLYGVQTAVAPFAHLVYEPSVAAWFSPWRTVCGVGCLTLLAVLCWRERERLGRPALFWGVWFVVLQLPTANFLRQEARFDERYVFLAWLAFPAVVAMLTTPLAAHAEGRRRAVAMVLAVVGTWGMISFNRARVFADDLTFSLQWSRTNPHSAIALNNVGNNLLERRRYAEAECYLRRALAVDPEMAGAHYNLGTTLYRLGRPDEAVTELREALHCDPAYRADYNLALALADAGQLDEAVDAYRHAMAKEPANPDVPYNLGLLLARRGDMASAIPEFRAATRIAPRDPKTWFNLGVALERVEKFDEAIEAYTRAKAADPRYADARFNLGNLLYRKERFTEAVEEYSAAAELNPNDAQFRQNLEAARQKTSRQL